MPGGELQAVLVGRTQFLCGADIAALMTEMPTMQWQSAAGRRLLTPTEEEARDRHFRGKFAGAMARFRSLGRRKTRRPSAA